MIDGVVPTVTGVDSTTADGTYAIGDVIDITIALDEVVLVTGTPTLLLETGTTDRKAIFTPGSGYSSGAGSNTLTFNTPFKTAIPPLTWLRSLPPHSSSAAAASKMPLATMPPSPSQPRCDWLASANTNLVIDGIKPTVLALTPPLLTAPTHRRCHRYHRTFDEVVFVTGTHTLLLETGTTDRKAIFTPGSGYSSGAGSNTYLPIHRSRRRFLHDLAQLSSSALELSGGTIKDAAGNSTLLTLPNPGATGSLSANTNLATSTPLLPPSLALTPPLLTAPTASAMSSTSPLPLMRSSLSRALPLFSSKRSPPIDSPPTAPAQAATPSPSNTPFKTVTPLLIWLSSLPPHSSSAAAPSIKDAAGNSGLSSISPTQVRLAR